MQGQLILLTILLALSAFFSGTETALVSVTMARVNLLLKNEAKGAETLAKLKSNTHKMLSTILIGNNLVNIAAAAITTELMIKLYGDNAVGIATGVLTLFVLIFGEITPKSIATRYSVKISLISAPIILLLSKLFTPIIWFLDIFTLKIINKLLGPAPKLKITEEELKNYIKLSEQSGSIDKDETEMLQNIIDFEDVTVKEIMTPKPQVKGVTQGDKVRDLIKLSTRTGHSRIPVFEKKTGKIIGIVLVKDILNSIGRGHLDVAVDSFMRKPHYIPESKRLDQLLKEFKRGKTHIAVVVDEYGHVSGLVTLEDVLEEIVGDLYDETDRIHKQVKKLTYNTYQILGLTYLADVNEILHIKLVSETDQESLAGFIVEKLGKIPVVGDKISIRGMLFVVEGVEENRITEVKLTFTRRKS